MRSRLCHYHDNQEQYGNQLHVAANHPGYKIYYLTGPTGSTARPNMVASSPAAVR